WLYLCYTYFDRHSEPLATCVFRKQRQWPPRYGTGSYLVSCHQPVVVEQSLKLLKHIGYQGLADLEFKHDHRDGELKLIEVNVRCGDPVALAIAARVDIPFIAYQDARGMPTEHANTYDINVTWVNAIDDFRAFWYYRKVEPLSGWRWLRSVLGARSHAYFAWDDPMPSFVHLGHRAVKAATYFPRRLKRNRYL
ncbi:MAG TPA: ATP-grasp domain-containing protein, partial [Thermoleophilaceae bacterium]|nr:ATP-grasp domain-containing protein [Thermoleophilaceae bacterium]